MKDKEGRKEEEEEKGLGKKGKKGRDEGSRKGKKRINCVFGRGKKAWEAMDKDDQMDDGYGVEFHRYPGGRGRRG